MTEKDSLSEGEGGRTFLFRLKTNETSPDVDVQRRRAATAIDWTTIMRMIHRREEELTNERQASYSLVLVLVLVLPLDSGHTNTYVRRPQLRIYLWSFTKHSVVTAIVSSRFSWKIRRHSSRFDHVQRLCTSQPVVCQFHAFLFFSFFLG